MKKLLLLFLSIITFSCDTNSSNQNPLEMKKQLNKDNKQVTVLVDVSI